MSLGLLKRWARTLTFQGKPHAQANAPTMRQNKPFCTLDLRQGAGSRSRGRRRQALPTMLPLKVGINAPGSRVVFSQGD